MEAPGSIESWKTSIMLLNNEEDITLKVDGAQYDISTGKLHKDFKLKNSKDAISIKYMNPNEFSIQKGVKLLTEDKEFYGDSGFVEIVYCNQKGNTYYIVTNEITEFNELILESVIIKVNTKGEIEGYARIPLEEYISYPNRYINVIDNGDIYVMEPKRDYVTISKVSLSATYETKLENKRQELKMNQSDEIITNQAVISRTRAQVQASADDIIAHTWQYKYENSINPPANVKKPTYLSTITNFPSWNVGIPYCWGGFRNITQFNKDISDNLFAGNINLSGNFKSGTTGLDCSGFVSVNYGLNTKYSSSDFTSFGREVSYDSLQNMDILVKSGHVLHFSEFSSDKSFVYSKESTIDGQEKCKRHQRSKQWITTNGYKARTPW